MSALLNMIDSEIKRTRDEEAERCLRLIEARIRRLEERLIYWRRTGNPIAEARIETSLSELRNVRDWIASPDMTEHDTVKLNPGGIPCTQETT